jgi:hypothetical protein
MNRPRPSDPVLLILIALVVVVAAAGLTAIGHDAPPWFGELAELAVVGGAGVAVPTARAASRATDADPPRSG